MSGKTKIFVWHMKEVIYTAIFVFLGLVLLFLLTIMFFPKNDTPSNSPSELTEPTETVASTDTIYQPGIYTANMTVGGSPVSLQIIIEKSGITDVSFVQLSESVETMYPLFSPVIENISKQLQSGIDIDEITYEDSQKYTASVILDTIHEVVDTIGTTSN